MKKPILKVRKYRFSKTHPFMIDMRAYGKGRKFFKYRTEAEAECLRQKTLLERQGREAVGLPQHELSEFITAKRKLAAEGKTINDATQFLLDHLKRVRRSGTTVEQLAAELMEAKKKDGMSRVYLKDLRHRLGTFSRDFGNRPIASITAEELDIWLRSLPFSPQSRMNFRTNIGVLFSHAERRRMIDFNPIKHTARPRLPGNPPEIFAVDELRALLTAAAAHEPEVLPMLAIGAFAGLRDAEIRRLDWSEVDLVRGHIDVKAAKAKSARRRIVPILPNLAAWLRPYSGMKGAVVPSGNRTKLAQARKVAGLPRWPNNGIRHSFASYRLAAIHDAPRASAELGHTSPQMLYSTYRELVLPEEAERYWKIAPSADATNVIPLHQTLQQ
jgi:integrase